MTEERAATLVRRLIAGFPYLNAHDPKGYVTALVEVMSQYPTWAGERTIVRVDEERPEFPPSDRTLRTWLDDAVRPYRYKMEWETRAKKQLAERVELEGHPPAETEAHGQVITNFNEAVSAHGRPIGAFEPGREHRYRG